MIIGINGYAGSGKDTVGEIIKQLQPWDQWEIKKFAGKLKEVASIILGIPTAMFENQEFKKKDLPQMWSNHGMPMTVRDFLQKLGTDGLRDGLHPNIWVNALMMDYIEQVVNVMNGEGYKLEDRYPNWIITDCRFPNEARAIKNKGGILVRINRPGFNPINDHPSEIALDGWNFDEVIENDSDLLSLSNKVKAIIDKYKYPSNEKESVLG